VTPPWLKIFKNDHIRTESFEESLRIHQAVLLAYTRLNYQVIELPLLPVKKRVEYLIQTIHKT
jgi:predicted ATPase